MNHVSERKFIFVPLESWEDKKKALLILFFFLCRISVAVLRKQSLRHRPVTPEHTPIVLPGNATVDSFLGT